MNEGEEVNLMQRGHGTTTDPVPDYDDQIALGEFQNLIDEGPGRLLLQRLQQDVQHHLQRVQQYQSTSSTSSSATTAMSSVEEIEGICGGLNEMYSKIWDLLMKMQRDWSPQQWMHLPGPNTTKTVGPIDELPPAQLLPHHWATVAAGSGVEDAAGTEGCH